MCTNGINTGQFEQMIDQIDDHIKLERRWAHNPCPQASVLDSPPLVKSFTACNALLDEVRATLDDAKDALDEDAENASGVTVTWYTPGCTGVKRKEQSEQ